VADAVREEQRGRAALDERLGRPAKDAELDEPFRDHQRRHAVDLAPLRSGTAGGDRCLAGAPDRVVDECLLGGERPAGGVRAGDVAGVAAVLGARVDEQ
jgi:hypothetical protein